MAVDRRAFLATGGALAAAALFPGSLLAAIEREAARSRRPNAAPGLRSWAAVRGLFDLEPGWTHMSSFFFVSHPRPVREAIEHYRKALDANPFLYLEHAMLESEEKNVQTEVRRAAAEYVGGKTEEIALMPNTTTGLALVYAGLPLKPGDEILGTTHDHYSQQESIRYTAQRSRATVRRIALYDRAAEASRDEIVARVRRNIRPARACACRCARSPTWWPRPIAGVLPATAC